MKSKTKKYYPNLNALRFIAATLVIVFHIELYKQFYDLPNLMGLNFFKIIGKLGVVLFFVLSGFLITSLLLKENDTTGGINFKSFYQRRILRIWPLYFLILGIGFFILPHFEYWKIPNERFVSVNEHFWIKLFLYIVILPNLAVVIFRDIVGVSQVWSLGTEEQFYLIWPLIIKCYRKKLLPVMFSILIIYFLVQLLCGKLAATSQMWEKVLEFWSIFNINCMAIGGIFAVVYHDNHTKLLNVIFNKYFFATCCSALLTLLFFGVRFPLFHYEIYSFLFGVIILNLACNTIYSTKLENKSISYLGSISYGLYMYHPMILPIGILIGKKYNSNVLIYIFTIGLTIVVASISYEYFEKYFLKQKRELNLKIVLK